MRGMEWDAAGGFRCRDCGGFEADLLEGGSARCRACGRVSVPTAPRRFAGIGRLSLWIFVVFLAVFAVEVVVSWAVSQGSVNAFRETFPVVAVLTGMVAIMFGGIGAIPGQVAMATQRYDGLGKTFLLQNPADVGALHTDAKARPTEEPGAAGIFLLVGLGIALILAGYLVTVA